MNETTAKEFLDWIGNEKNIKEAKKALAKNTTYNSDYFDDIFQDTIIKVYNSIINGNEVKDFKNYFFISLKFNYIQKDNKMKSRQKQEVYLDSKIDMLDDSDLYLEVYKDKAITEAIERIREILSKSFNSSDIDLFIQYYQMKDQQYTMGYRELSSITGVNIKYISQLIPKMRRYIRENKEAIKIKETLKENAVY